MIAEFLISLVEDDLLAVLGGIAGAAAWILFVVVFNWLHPAKHDGGCE